MRGLRHLVVAAQALQRVVEGFLALLALCPVLVRVVGGGVARVVSADVILFRRVVVTLFLKGGVVVKFRADALLQFGEWHLQQLHLQQLLLREPLLLNLLLGQL